MKKYIIHILGLTGILVSGFLFNSCNPVDYEERTNYQLLIGQYLQENPDKFSTFMQVLEKSESLAFLEAYGTYTVFAPTNEAWAAFFQKTGKDLKAYTKEELQDIVRYHIIIDTINSTQFVDGKLPTPTMYGQYLTTRVAFENGNAKIKVNKISTIESVDLRMLNGIIHSVQTVLEPITLSISKLIEENPSYSLFTQALKATGYYDTLNIIPSKTDIDPRWFTVFVIPDTAYHKDGIFTFGDLKTTYSSGSDYTSKTDSLNLYVAYHILDYSLKYISDLLSQPAHNTKVPLEIITIKSKGDSVLVNEDEFAGMIERGYAIDRPNSDNTAANGVYHVMMNTPNKSGNFGIKVRKPMAVYWEVTDQPEIRKMPGVFRRIGSTVLRNGNLANISWYGDGNTITYQVGDQYPYYVFNDYFNINLRPEVIKWIEFKTPILVKGKYKIWICTRNVWGANNRKSIFFCYFDDVVLPTVINNQVTLSHHTKDEEYELTGWKWYQINPKDSMLYKDTICTNAAHYPNGVFAPPYLTLYGNYISEDGVGRYAGQLAGTVDIEATGVHTVKFVGITGTNGCWLDQIHFIPVENNQIWPRVNTVTGALVYKEQLPPHTH